MKNIAIWLAVSVGVLGLSAYAAFKFLPDLDGQPNLNDRGIYKLRSVYMPNRMEATPIAFGLSLYSIVNKRPHRGEQGSSELLVSKLYGGSVASVPIPNLGLISAFVNDGKAYVFARTYAVQNELQMLESADLKTWSEPVTVMKAALGQNILNTSVTRGPDGFVMAYEVAEPGVVGFAPRFATSPDLRNWTPIGEPFDRNRYAACPTLRYIDGWYYMLYLTILDEDNPNKRFVTIAARSRDLKTWQHATKPAFEPAAGEGNNNSDVDMVERFGITTFLYATGDQQDEVSLKRAVYLGSEGNFFRQFEYADKRL
ncbi:hypothetical protein [Polaromonas sp.]|jgi:alpha-L-fucosidase|uniref:hypothetical protein n=1 Tax=Polaromonas sp. TaxID=1869339 RepID=UPI0037C92FDF